MSPWTDPNRRSGRRLGVAFGDIDPGAPGMHHIHRSLLPRHEDLGLGAHPGEGRKFRSLTLVLKGNSPRFPWEPSTTMLTYRLTGTTENSVSNRDEPFHCAERS